MTIQADNFIARTTGFGPKRTAAYRALIDGLVGNGVWAKLDALYVLATLNAASGYLNLVSTSWTITNANSLPFSADAGFTNDGNSTHVLDTGFTPNTAGGLWVQNSAHLSAWNTLTAANNTNNLAINSGGTIPLANIYPQYTDGHAYGRINDPAGDGGVAVSSSTGFYTVSRTGASASVLYNNASVLYSPNNTSTGLPSTNIVFISGPYTITAASLGGGLTGTDATNLYNGLNTYMALLPFGADLIVFSDSGGGCETSLMARSGNERRRTIWSS